MSQRIDIPMNIRMLFCYVDRAVVLDHWEKKLYLLSEGEDRTWIEEVKTSYREEKISGGRAFFQLSEGGFCQQTKEYLESIRKSQDLIAQGESYEICLTNRLELFAKVCPVDYYLLLRKVSPAPYSAFSLVRS